MQERINKIKAVMIGHAIGDALGVPVEFKARSDLGRSPVTDMRGYGTYDLPAGSWSDDTSMSLAALDSLGKGIVDWNEIMGNFTSWCYENEYTPTGETFDVGITCSKAIRNFSELRKDALECGLSDEYSNGNGSLMRIHPFVLYAHFKQMPFDEWEQLIFKASSMTHAHARSKLGCVIYAFILMHLLDDSDVSAVRTALRRAYGYYYDHAEFEHYKRLFDENFDKLDIREIRSTGYVVDTLEAAVWSLLTTDSYKECVLKAVNLGGDTDTVAAVAGGLAGALYGYENIPREWKEKLIREKFIEGMCEKAANSLCPTGSAIYATSEEKAISR